jgi:hypothetical protein
MPRTVLRDLGALHGDLPPVLRVTPFTIQPRRRMSLTKNSTAFDSMMQEAHEQAERLNLDQLYLEYIHDQACIQRDAVTKLLFDTPDDKWHDALYEYFYEQVKRKP